MDPEDPPEPVEQELAQLELGAATSDNLQKPKGPIFIDDADQVAQAEKLFSEVASFKRKVDQCLVSGIARRQSCNCLYPARLDSVRRVLGDSLSAYPHWDERAILWWASGSGEPLNIQLGRVILWTENVCADLAFSNP